jgi:hypothetical protein
VRARRTKEATQSDIEAQVMAEYEAEKAIEREEWATGARMPTTYRDPRTGKLTGSRTPDSFIGPRLPTFLATLPHSMCEEQYNAAMDALAAGTITPEQEASLAQDAADDEEEDDELGRLQPPS